MTIRKKLLLGGLAGLSLLATAATAFAAPAVATSNVNVRSGPGTGYGVVDTLRRGEPVDVRQCQGSWCYVEKSGPDGWVSSSYLGRGGNFYDDEDDYYTPRPPRPPVYDPYPPRPPHWNPRPPRPPHWDNRPPRPRPYPVYPSNPGASFCFNGPNGYFCAGS
jgi:uncharacterized protein YraI